jgi:hypothetical protein
MITGGWIVGDMGEGFSFMGMEDKADVYGRVTFTNGTPVDGANVSIVGEPLTAETDETGNYLIYNVPTGNHKIKVEFEGYNTIIYKTFIGPEESRWDDSSRQGKSADNKYDFTLTPGDDTIERGSYPPFELIRGIMTICGVLVLIFSVIVLLGGLYALKRKNFMITILAAILGILTFGFFVGSLFALIALFILIISRDEFKRNDEMEGNMP